MSKRTTLMIAAISAVGTLGISRGVYADDAAAPSAAPATQPSGDAAELVKQLGADDFHTRQAAAKKLKEMGKAALPALQEGRKSPDLEIHSRAEQLLGEIEIPPAAPLPQPTGGGNQSLSTSVFNDEKTIDAHEPGRTTHIEENAKGITMKVTGQLDGKQVTQEYKAKNAAELKRTSPEAFALYQQFNGDGMQAGINGIPFQNRVRINVGGANGNVMVLPVPNNPPGDDVDKLESTLRDQMKAANIADDKQKEVKDELDQLREALNPAKNLDKHPDTRMKDYNTRCDALRKTLADLKLPDPGDALPPPAWGRLGISAMEETGGTPGLTVTHVLPDSRAVKMGLKEQDVIQKVNGQDIHSTRDLRKLVTQNPKGLVIDALRDGKPVKLEEEKAK